PRQERLKFSVDMSKYKALFYNESQDRLASLDQSILVLEKNPADLERIDEMFRAFHSIKGMAASMGFTLVANLAHALEDLLESARESRQPLPAAWIEPLLAGRDHLETLIKTHEKDEPIESLTENVQAFIQQVRDLSKKGAESARPPASST